MSPSNDLQTRAWETTLEAAIANTLASSTAMVQHLNSELKKRYDSEFESWKTSVIAGKIDNTKPPQPPTGYELLTGPGGFSFAEPGTKPVCEPRTDIPPDYSKPAVREVGELEAVNLKPGDTHKTGDIVTGIELLHLGVAALEIGTPTSRWELKEVAGPWGKWRWYQRLR